MIIGQSRRWDLFLSHQMCVMYLPPTSTVPASAVATRLALSISAWWSVHHRQINTDRVKWSGVGDWLLCSVLTPNYETRFDNLLCMWGQCRPRTPCAPEYRFRHCVEQAARDGILWVYWQKNIKKWKMRTCISSGDINAQIARPAT